MTRQESITLQQVVCKMDEAKRRAHKYACYNEDNRPLFLKAWNDWVTWNRVYRALRVAFAA